MAFTDRLNTMNIYQALTNNPLTTLGNNDLVAQNLAGNDTAVVPMAFCYVPGAIVVDPNGLLAAAMIAGGNNDTYITKNMVVTPMRASTMLPVNRHAQTALQGIMPINPTGADLWVTDNQTGCMVLILDWGGNQYSMVHLQPYGDNQYNALGRFILGRLDRWTRGFSRVLYQDYWLKQDATQVTSNTGGVPQRYIMVESMWATSGGTISQILGVRAGNNWRFFLQRISGGVRHAQEMQWTGYNSYMPYMAY